MFCGALLLWTFLDVARAQTATEMPDTEAKAVAYLAGEVPRWYREHACFSCHNNGDAARALIMASARGHAVGGVLDDTIAWLAAPERWSSNGSPGGSEDLPLAHVQFSSALASAVSHGRAASGALERGGQMLVADQRPDGSWRPSESQLLGGATFYGTSLATAMARRSLSQAGTGAANGAILRANRWLRTASTATVLDASAIVLGLAGDDDPTAVVQRGKALEVLSRGQGPDGGWGPYVTSRSEPFDTALAVLALAGVSRAADVSPGGAESIRDRDLAVMRGRQYLIGSQTPEGSWPETTRPPGGESYAQRISTTAWALMAMLESR